VRISGTLDDNNRPRFTLNLEWSSRATVIDDGWIAEMAIPLRSIPFQGSDLVSMSFKIARFIARKGEEVNLPEMKPGQREYEQYREISLHDVLRSTTSWSDFYLNGLVSLRRERLQVAKLPHEKQIDKWGDATTLDYLIFPSRELKQSSHPFHFKRVLEDQHVATSVATLEYAPGKKVSDLERFLNRTATTSFIVIKDDGIIYERYFDGYRRDSIVTSFSVAKSFVSTLIGMAIDEGKIGSVNDSITRYLPELAQRDPRFNRITIRDLLLMSSGIRYHEADPNNDDDITYHAADLRRAALESTVIVDEPGKHWHYNNYHPLLLGLILERVTGQSVTDYMQRKLWAPLEMEYSGSWSVNGSQNGLEKMESGINARAIDFAKLGRLLLNGGRWGGKQLLSENWIEQATQPDTKPASYYNDGPFFTSLGHYYSYFWWGSERSGGKSDFSAVGNKGQYIYVSPQKSVIIVRSGFDYGIPNSRWLRLFYQLADRL
jgi:CubicO group peptidase (beta-lactamase class C family)